MLPVILLLLVTMMLSLQEKMLLFKKANQKKKQVIKANRQVKLEQAQQLIAKAKQTPYTAQQKHGKCSSDIFELNDFLAAIVKWFPEKHYAFAESTDGHRFFVHISQCKEGFVAFA